MITRTFITVLCFTLAMIIGACDRLNGPLDSSSSATATTYSDVSAELALKPVASTPTPSGQVTASVGDQSLTFWPYSTNNFDAVPQDPINLVFYGQCDPRQIRAALMSLDGDRTAFGFPPAYPFNATWQDAIGDVQAAYGNGDWTGGVIQLACGDYQPVRVHLRLFTMGEWTVGNAHFEVLIPGTADHQVLNWEIAEQLVIADFMRSGLLDPSAPVIPTEQINDAPFRTIPAVIYNGLPVELKSLIGGPLGEVIEDVPIGTDGHAVILNLANAVPVVAEQKTYSMVIQYGQVVPKPFCNDGDDYVYVEGPVTLEQTVTVDPQHAYQFTFKATGTLGVTPIDPGTGQPIGETLSANVAERHWGHLNDNTFSVSSTKRQALLPLTAPGAGSYATGIRIMTNGRNAFSEEIECNDMLLTSN